MNLTDAAPGARLLDLWTRLSQFPGGRWAFSRVLGRMVPYSGTIRAQVAALEPGYACLLLRDRRRVRNHLGSVHAIALANVGELTSGLAVLTGLPPTVRGIVTHLEIRYTKKARGTLTTEARVEVPPVKTTMDLVVETEIRDETDDIVATVSVRWRLSPFQPS